MMNGRGTPEAAHFATPAKRLTTAIVSAFLATGLATGCSIYGNHKVELPRDSKFAESVVTAAHPLAAEAGAKVLEEGGNAIDAAVVTQFVLNVVEPTSSGIGGGGFMGIYQADKDRVFYIDSREKAPAAATPTQFLSCGPDCTEDETSDDSLGNFTDIATSGIGVGVPGTLLGAAQSLEKYGTLTLAEALAPAIVLAEDGFEINERLAELTASSRTGFWPETAARFRTPERLTDFNIVPQATIATADDFKPGANDIAPQKRPRSSMAPSMVFKDDKLIAAYGSPGGSTIINSVVNMTVNLLDHGMSVQDAIDAPRISTSGGSISHEVGFDPIALDELTTLGHTLSDEPGDIGSIQSVTIDQTTGLVDAGADARRAGTVVGLPRQ